MSTEKDNRDEIRTKILEKLKGIDPRLAGDFYKLSIPVGKYRVDVEISGTKPYMGRFGAGKSNWTINVKEKKSYSRSDVIRIKFDEQRNPSFDADRLIEAIAKHSQIIQDAEALEAKKKDAMLSIIDRSGTGLSVFAHGNRFSVKGEWCFASAEEVNALIKSVKSLSAEIN